MPFERLSAHGVFYMLCGRRRDDSPPILLLHGLGNSADIWGLLLPELGHYREVIAPDLPGFGRSRRPDLFGMESVAERVADVVDIEGHQEVVVVGHSLGGMVALRVAQLLGGRAVRVVLVSAPPLTASSVIRTPRLGFEHRKIAANLAVQAIGASFPAPVAVSRRVLRNERLRRCLLGPFVAHPERLDPHLLPELFAHNGGKAALETVVLAKESNVEQLLTATNAPVSFVKGDLDRLVPNSDLAEAARLVKGGGITIINDCGHWPHVEQPRVLTQILLEGDSNAG